MWAFFLLHRWPFSHCVCTWKKQWESSIGSLKTLISFLGALPHDVIASQRLHLLVPSHLGLWFKIWMCGGGHKHSVHNTNFSHFIVLILWSEPFPFLLWHSKTSKLSPTIFYMPRYSLYNMTCLPVGLQVTGMICEMPITYVTPCHCQNGCLFLVVHKRAQDLKLWTIAQRHFMWVSWSARWKISVHLHSPFLWLVCIYVLIWVGLYGGS